MLREKGILILKTGEIKSTMHYTTLEGKVAIITTKTLKNIPDIKNDPQVELLVGKNSYEASATIIDEEQQVKAIFDQMLAENNTYFTTFTDDLVAIKFTVKE